MARKRWEVNALNCQICGAQNPQSTKYCFRCGSEIEQPAKFNVAQRVSLGDYEVADYDNPADLVLPDINLEEPIFDRDEKFWPGKPTRRVSGGIFVNLMLIGLLFLIVTLSYFGVNAVAKIRQDKQIELVRQVEAQKDAVIKAQKEEYLKKYREFIILAQAQGQDFTVNLQELTKIEGSRWLKNIFLDGIFNGMIQRFTQTKSYTAMTNRSKNLSELLRALADPPPEFKPLYLKIQAVQKSGQAITDVFTGELDETAQESIKGLLPDFENQLADASNAL